MGHPPLRRQIGIHKIQYGIQYMKENPHLHRFFVEWVTDGHGCETSYIMERVGDDPMDWNLHTAVTHKRSPEPDTVHTENLGRSFPMIFKSE